MDISGQEWQGGGALHAHRAAFTAQKVMHFSSLLGLPFKLLIAKAYCRAHSKEIAGQTA
jgi:hypothetical protein